MTREHAAYQTDYAKMRQKNPGWTRRACQRGPAQDTECVNANRRRSGANAIDDACYDFAHATGTAFASSPHMGKVMTKLKITNNIDAGSCARGLLDPDQVRSVEVEALVDTGATTLCLPEDIVNALGLRELNRRKVKLADGSIREMSNVTGALIEILGREMSCDALVTPAGTTPLIGQIPLEALDLLVDPKSRDVHVNPASPDMPLLDLMKLAS